jgi:hypothetical protein
MHARMGEALAQPARQGFPGASTIHCGTGVTALDAMDCASAKALVARRDAVN